MAPEGPSPRGLHGQEEDDSPPPPTLPRLGLQTERRKTGTAAQDNLALSSGAEFWAGGKRPQNDLGPSAVAAAAAPSAQFCPYDPGLFTLGKSVGGRSPGCLWEALEFQSGARGERYCPHKEGGISGLRIPEMEVNEAKLQPLQGVWLGGFSLPIFCSSATPR